MHRNDFRRGDSATLMSVEVDPRSVASTLSATTLDEGCTAAAAEECVASDMWTPEVRAPARDAHSSMTAAASVSNIVVLGDDDAALSPVRSSRYACAAYMATCVLLEPTADRITARRRLENGRRLLCCTKVRCSSSMSRRS